MANSHALVKETFLCQVISHNSKDSKEQEGEVRNKTWLCRDQFTMPLLCYDREHFVIKKVMVLQAEERLLSTMNWGMFDDEEEVYVENTSIL